MLSSLLVKLLMHKKVTGIFAMGFVCGFLAGAMHTDHTFKESVDELIVIGNIINEELEELEELE